MATRSAGLLVHRSSATGTIEVLLVHPGGPFWARRDLGAWSIPKGEYADDEDPLAAARREFAEELGQPAPGGPATPLGEVRQKAGKRVLAWAIEGDLDPATVASNTFTMPSNQVAVAIASPPDQVATGQGLLGATGLAVAGLAALGGAAAYEAFGRAAVFIGTATVMAALVLAARWRWSVHARALEAEPTT